MLERIRVKEWAQAIHWWIYTSSKKVNVGQFLDQIFDPGFYVINCGDQIDSGSARIHFATKGNALGLSPSPFFSCSWYANITHQTGRPTTKLLEHYCKFFLQFDPHPLFNRGYYERSAKPNRSVNPLIHYALRDTYYNADWVSPTPFFAPDFYLRRYPDIAKAGIDPFVHYLTYGWRERRQPSPYFSTAWYLARYPDILEAGVEPLQHFITTGLGEGRQPHHLIDIDYYCSGAPDVVNAKANPYIHFIEHGDREGRSAHPLFEPAYYRANGAEIVPRAAFAHYAEFGASRGRSPCPAFDPSHYSTHYPDEADDPILRFLLAPPGERRHVHPLLDGDYQSMTALNVANGANMLTDYVQFRSHFAEIDVAGGKTAVPRASKLPFATAKVQPTYETGWSKISVIIPCYNSNVVYLETCISSIIAQTYKNWELILIDDGSSDDTTWAVLQEYQKREDRVKALRLAQNQNISGATNAGIQAAEGEFLAFVDHDDVLLPTALEAIISALSEQNFDVGYSDQAFLSANGAVEELSFKPDWSPALFSGVMYVGHLLVVRRSVAIAAGLFKPKFDGCQDYEFMLRVSEITNKILHVPQVLYYWRRAEGSVAADSNAKGRLETKQALAVAEHFARIKFQGTAIPDERVPHRLRVRPRPRTEPRTELVSIDVIQHAPQGMVRTSLEAQFGSIGAKIESLEVCDWNNPPTRCVGLGEAPWILFLDPAIGFIDTSWLACRLMYAERDDIAFVASHIFAADHKVISAGLVAVPGVGLVDAYPGFAEGQDGTLGTLFCDREVTALGAGCTLISRNRLAKLGGLGSDFVSCEGAVNEASYRATMAGLRNISIATPLVTSPGAAGANTLRSAVDRQIFLEMHGANLATGDRYYNPNLVPDRGDFSY